MRVDEFKAFFERISTPYEITKLNDRVSRVDFVDRGVVYAGYAYENDGEFLQLVHRCRVGSNVDRPVLDRALADVQNDLRLVKLTAVADDGDLAFDISTEQLEPDAASAEHVFWRTIDEMANAERAVMQRLTNLPNKGDGCAAPPAEALEKGLQAGCHAELDATPVLKSVRSALGLIVTENGSGSAFCFRASQDAVYFLTNSHVVEDQASVTVYMQEPDFAKFSGTVVAKAPTTEIDLAVVKISGVSVPTLAFADELPMCGSPIAVGGYPRVQFSTAVDFGEIVPSVHFGNVTAINASETQIMHDALSRPGNSGGPLFDPATGEVVGVETLGWEQDETFIAISEKSVAAFLEKHLADIDSPEAASRPMASHKKGVAAKR